LWSSKTTQIIYWLLYNNYENFKVNSRHYSLQKQWNRQWPLLTVCKSKFSTTMVKQGQQKAPLKQEESFKLRLLNDDSIRWLYTQIVKLHLNNTKENWMDIEKECWNLQNILKSAANESLGKIKGRNRRKYLKIWDDEIKQLIETRKKSYKYGWIHRHQKTNWNTTETQHWPKQM